MLRNSTTVYLFAILCTLMVTPAQARQRSFVASYGDDANICDTFFPCRTFAKALTVTDPNGEVLALDSSGYGPVTLTQSVSLAAAPGAYAGIAVFPGTSGVTIGAGVSVVLRGLTINGLGGDNGILLSGISDLSIENCVISNFSGFSQRGVLVNTAATVRMVNTLVRDNDTGIELQGGATATISKSKFLGNAIGIFANGATSTTTATVRDTFVTGGFNGILAFSETASANNRINVIRSTISNSFFGVSSEAHPSGTASVTISKSMVTGSDFGLYMQGAPSASATVKSTGNNTVTGNINDTSDPLTPISTM
ncbi:right-handed parallel beta-helix repeat-containing protein [Candidatus Nitrotoga arctica]|uniref:Right handed beta helix region n=1 Tax=Candidatus Nitrotoga arctica TaxID=453162 RepID=A0ABN8AND4_9PROT|nr:right-handed parallel beta-helix repeat-containing protein [Candidatus Nitrotoga arctica]CAG9933552.1 Right handed beta helix region [Candidatus Nitrotoga arctica]